MHEYFPTGRKMYDDQNKYGDEDGMSQKLAYTLFTMT